MTTAKPSASTYAASRRAFTLLEMVVATAIVSLTVMAIYEVVSLNLRAVTEMEIQTRREREVAGFESMVREWVDNWRDPQRVALNGLPHKFGQLPSDEFSFNTRSGNPLLSAAAGEGDYTVTLLYKDDGENGTLGVRRTAEGQVIEANRDWVPVLTETKGLEIRYFDPIDKEWIDTWNGRNDLPRLLKMRIWLAERGASHDFIVSIPPRGQSL